jgi:uncharacterized membrane protein
VPTVPQRTSALTTTLVGVGLLTCIYLAGLKLLGLSCPLSGCANIINTHYGSLFHVPLPLFAIPLWLTLTVPSARPWQIGVQLASLLALAAGALVLMVIQFFVLKGFCPFCTLHAACALVAAFVVPRQGRAHAWLSPVLLALALPILFAVKVIERNDVQSWNSPEEPAASAPAAAAPVQAQTPPPPAIPASVDKAAFTWLGDFDPKESPFLVVSFQCSHCLDLLEETLTHPHMGSLKGPKILVYAAHGNSPSTIAVLAAILSMPGTPQEQFAAVFAQQDSFRDALITHDTAELKARLAELFPAYTTKLEAAQQLFALQVTALKYIPGRGSPYILFPDGSSKFGSDVTPAMLFH